MGISKEWIEKNYSIFLTTAVTWISPNSLLAETSGFIHSNRDIYSEIGGLLVAIDGNFEIQPTNELNKICVYVAYNSQKSDRFSEAVNGNTLSSNAKYIVNNAKLENLFDTYVLTATNKIADVIVFKVLSNPTINGYDSSQAKSGDYVWMYKNLIKCK